MALVATVASIPGLTFSIYYLHLLPEPMWYYEFRSWNGVELLVLPIGVAGGAIASLFPHVLRVVFLLGVVALSVAPVCMPFIKPFKKGVLTDKWKKEVCMQSSGSTCGPASLATIFKHYGQDVKEAELAKEAYSYRGGTEAWYLARAARARDLEVSFEHYEQLPTDLKLPAIVGVKLGGVGHFIPVLERKGGRWITGDPLHGKRSYTSAQFYGQYEFTGFVMLIRK